MKSIGILLKQPSFYLGIARYLLAWGMIPYGITKILQTQFVILPVGISQLPLEQISGRVLAWAFLGYAPWFQILLGILEFSAAVLLMFRKTALAGALLMFPLLLNVCLINFALHLWPGTQLISCVFLILNIIVLIFYRKEIAVILATVFPARSFSRFLKMEWSVNLIFIGFLIFLNFKLLFGYIQDTNELTGDWYHQQPFEWKLKELKVNDSLTEFHNKSIFFGAFGNYGELDEKNVLHNLYYYSWNREENILELLHNENGEKLEYSLRFNTDSELVLQKTDSLNNTVSETYAVRTINLGNRNK